MERLLLLAFVLLLTSCNSDYLSLSNHAKDNYKLRSAEDAIALADSFVNQLGLVSAATSDSELVYVFGNDSRSSEDTLIYVVEYSDNNGYTLVSAAKRGEPILAFVEDESFELDDLMKNESFNFFFERAKEYVSMNLADSIHITLPPLRPQSYTIVNDAPAKLTTKWGQHYPEGLFCPNGVSGCVQTAEAMILSYFAEPRELKLTYPDRDRDMVYLDWEDINKHKESIPLSTEYFINSHLNYCEAPQWHHAQLAYLCRQLGAMNRADYSNPKVTGSAIEYALLSLQELLPQRHVGSLTPFDESQYSSLIKDLKSGGIAIVGGASAEDNTGRHAWVCDGGREYIRHTGLLLADGTERVDYSYYFHFNWGYCGSFNGYFYGGVFDTSKAQQESQLPDIYSSRTDYKYNVKYRIVK
ncbi:MAG: C10 family peptidase [Muribaculaceae bacterium]|nr:C10 family peptidase [Muribaculaceae bacterium]